MRHVNCIWVSKLVHVFSAVRLISISIVNGSGFENYAGGIIEVDFIYKKERKKAVICDFERDGSKISAQTICYLLN